MSYNGDENTYSTCSVRSRNDRFSRTSFLDRLSRQHLQDPNRGKRRNIGCRFFRKTDPRRKLAEVGVTMRERDEHGAEVDPATRRRIAEKGALVPAARDSRSRRAARFDIGRTRDRASPQWTSARPLTTRRPTTTGSSAGRSESSWRPRRESLSPKVPVSSDVDR